MSGRLARVLDWDDVIKLLHSRVESVGGQSPFARPDGYGPSISERSAEGQDDASTQRITNR